MITRDELFSTLYKEYEEIVVRKTESEQRVIAIGELTNLDDEINIDFDVHSILDREGKTFFTFSQIAGLFGVKPDHFKGIVDDAALSLLAKYRSRLFCSMVDQQIEAIIVSGVTPQEVKTLENFFKGNIETYEKYQYYSTEVDYELEDGIVYDFTEVDFTSDIVNVILYFK